MSRGLRLVCDYGQLCADQEVHESALPRVGTPHNGHIPVHAELQAEVHDRQTNVNTEEDGDGLFQAPFNETLFSKHSLRSTFFMRFATRCLANYEQQCGNASGCPQDNSGGQHSDVPDVMQQLLRVHRYIVCLLCVRIPRFYSIRYQLEVIYPKDSLELSTADEGTRVLYTDLLQCQYNEQGLMTIIFDSKKKKHPNNQVFITPPFQKSQTHHSAHSCSK